MNSLKLYPENTFDKLELFKVFELIKQNCVSSLGERYVSKLKPSVDYDFVVKALNQVVEFKYVEIYDDPFPIDNYHDLEDLLNYLEIINSFLPESEFLKILLFNRTARNIFNYFKQRAEQYPELKALLKQDAFNLLTVSIIEKIINDEGAIKKGVSSELDRIQKDIVNVEKQLEKQFQKVLKHASSQGWLESGEESFRNGRQVLSLLSEHKRKIKGIVHDESATGKTVFLEPEASVELNNELFDLKQKEKREIIRILQSLATELRPYISDIRFYQRVVGLMDFIRAKAITAKKLDAEMPKISEDNAIDLKDAKHPLLMLHNRQLNKTTVPLNLQLDKENRILVISGPNAGGKSVALKTIGILQLMLQSGLLVPVSADSTMSIFPKMYVELGDAQSIENDLSTYSSHLTNMRHLSENADEQTLFLIDEFGTGTDPKFGGAIAEAILEELTEKKAVGVVNTHYSNLKMFASRQEHVVNGSMLFDVATLAPLYVLKIGQPGSSYAFEIARKTGLSENIIRNAEKKVDSQYREFDSLLATLETDKYLVETQLKKNIADQKELSTLISLYKELKTDLEKNKNKILLENKQKALKSLEDSNKALENLLKEIRTKEKSKEREQEARIEIKQKKENLRKEIHSIQKKSTIHVLVKEIRIGSLVKLLNGEESGIVEEIRKDQILVAFKTLKTKVKKDDLFVIETTPMAVKSKGLKTNSSIQKITEDFTPEIDVRGKRTDEALREVEVQLDKALLLSYPSVRILHGKGYGILRKMIREMLQKYDFIKDFYSESEKFGGEGITIVELK